MGAIGCVILWVIIAGLVVFFIYGSVKFVPSYCPFCGDGVNDEYHWCDGKISALRESQKNVYDHTKGNHRVRRGQKVMLINQCECGKIGRIDILIDATRQGDTREVFLQGYTCEKCKELV